MPAWYEKNVTKIGNNTLDLGALTLPKIIAIKTGEYVLSQAHEFLSDVPALARLATTTLTTVAFGTILEAWLSADDPTFLAPPLGQVSALIIYDDTGVEGASPLICFIDSGVGLPIDTQSGRDLNVSWNGGRIAKLG